MSEKPEAHSKPGNTPTTAKTRSQSAAATHKGAEDTQGMGHKRGGKALALLALLSALGVAGGTYYYNVQLRAADQHGGQRIDAALERDIAAMRGEQQRIIATQRRIEELIDRNRSAITGLYQKQQELSEALASTPLATPSGPHMIKWNLAEIEDLLTVANRRLVLVGDVQGASAALHEVSSMLAQLADPTLQPVRNQIAAELRSLAALPAIDLDDMAAQLAGLIAAVDQLHPIIDHTQYTRPIPRDGTETEGDTSNQRTLIDAIWTDLKTLVTIRRHDPDTTPLIRPDQRPLLRHSLRLRLESARLALLQRNTDLYHDMLREAEEWSSRYLVDEDDATIVFLATLRRLKKADIALQRPDISASLRLLRKVIRERSNAAVDIP